MVLGSDDCLLDKTTGAWLSYLLFLIFCALSQWIPFIAVPINQNHSRFNTLLCFSRPQTACLLINSFHLKNIFNMLCVIGLYTFG